MTLYMKEKMGTHCAYLPSSYTTVTNSDQRRLLLGGCEISAFSNRTVGILSLPWLVPANIHIHTAASIPTFTAFTQGLIPKPPILWEMTELCT
jgi:hypothetical protein